MYLLITYIKSVLWRVAKCLSYTEEARCLKVKKIFKYFGLMLSPTKKCGGVTEGFLCHRDTSIALEGEEN